MTTAQTAAETYALPSTLQYAGHHDHAGETSTRKSWRAHLGLLTHSGSRARQAGADADGLQQTATNPSSRSRRAPKWWKVRLFRGMVNDVRRRAPFYWSDWRDAWDYRVVPATVYMYFAKYGPPWSALELIGWGRY